MSGGGPRTDGVAPDIDALRAWRGRSETRHDVVTAAPAAALAATLDRDDPPPREGDPLPPLWHWLYCLPVERQSLIAADGHARRGDFLPPVPLPRRMQAGARLRFLRPLAIGSAIGATATVADVSGKTGRSGPLVFVSVERVIGDAAGPAITEAIDIVYREARRPGEAAPAPRPPPAAAVWTRGIVPDPVLLFRYSALTFNGHRIHYDRRYATEVEGYPGLVVHGPLLATLLLDHLRRCLPDAVVAAFDYSAVKPVFDTAPFALCAAPASDGRRVHLWVQDAAGALSMDATATLA